MHSQALATARQRVSITLGRPVPVRGRDPAEVLAIAAAGANHTGDDPVDAAVLAAVPRKLPSGSFEPPSAERPYSVAIAHEVDHSRICIARGEIKFDPEFVPAIAQG